MDLRSSRFAKLLQTSRWAFAGFWAAVFALTRFTDFFLSDLPASLIVVRQGIVFALAFTVAAFVVWPICQLQRRTGLPFVSMGSSLVCFALVYPFAWSCLQLARRSSIRFYWDTGEIEFSRVRDPLLFWLFPAVFAVVSAAFVIFGVHFLRVTIRRMKERPASEIDIG